MQQRRIIDWERNAMTFQIGIAASDGIILASDTLLQQIEGMGWSRATMSKFLIRDRFACCWSGDIVAQTIAQQLIHVSWSDLDQESVRDELCRVADETVRQFQDAVDYSIIRKVMVACHDQLWLLDILPVRSLANIVMDRVVAGDPKNTARHFPNRYADGCYHSPLNRMILLAAHTILAAGRENPHGIDGLEMVVIRRNEAPEFIPKDRIDRLRSASEEITSLIERIVFRVPD